MINYRIILSPAKTLDWESPIPTKQFSLPTYLKSAAELVAVLQKKSEDEIGTLMKISPALARLNSERFRVWKLDHHQDTRPAIYAYHGDVYVGLDAYTMNTQTVKKAQERMRIISGLYGLLKPLDLIHPYRLEMSTPLSIGLHKNLYQYWANTLTEELNQEIGTKDYLINLASEEYAKAIQPSQLQAHILTPKFYDYKNGKYKIVSFFAKKARGQMARYILENELSGIENLKLYDIDGYSFNEPLSKGSEWAFVRG